MRIPPYSHHKATGQAYVKLNGKFIYLGKYGSEESHEKHKKVIGEWLITGQTPAKVEWRESVLTVDQLFVCYLEHCREYYQRDGEPTGEYQSHIYLRNKISRIADLPASGVTPATVDTLRDEWIKAGNCRKFINQSVGRFVRMFKWAVTKNLVDVAVWQRLTAVSGLRAGRSKARDNQPVGPADATAFERACEFMQDELSHMVQVQRLSGARPGELFILRPCDIDRSSDVWTYTPRSHKTQHHGKQRRIWMGPQAQRLLLPYLLRPADELCFRHPSGRKWDRHRYREAVHAACKLAGVETFNPNQLRHSAGTEVRKRYGLDGAQTLLGHSHADVTQVYAEVDNTKGRMIAKEIG